MILHRYSMAALFAICVLLTSLVGCGPSYDKVTVSGIVSTKGTNLNWGRIRFINSKGNEIGNFILKNDGSFFATDLPLEELKVAVEVGDSSKGTPAPKAPPGTTVIPDANPRPEKIVDVPEKYKKADTTTATVKITAPNQKLEIKLD